VINGIVIGIHVLLSTALIALILLHAGRGGGLAEVSAGHGATGRPFGVDRGRAQPRQDHRVGGGAVRCHNPGARGPLVVNDAGPTGPDD